MNPIRTQQIINAVHDDRIRNDMERSFGTGTVGGDRNWTPPVHGSTRSGKPVTVSFGQGPRNGQTLICDGHVTMREFYARARNGKGHDHYLADGRPAGGRYRGRYTDEE